MDNTAILMNQVVIMKALLSLVTDKIIIDQLWEQIEFTEKRLSYTA